MSLMFFTISGSNEVFLSCGTSKSNVPTLLFIFFEDLSFLQLLISVDKWDSIFASRTASGSCLISGASILLQIKDTLVLI